MPGSQRQQCSFTHRHLHPPAPCRCLCGIALDLTSPASADWGLGKCTQHVGGQTPHLARLPTRLHSQGPEDTSLWGLACTPSEIHEFSVQRYREVMMRIISFLLLIKYFVLRIQKKKIYYVWIIRLREYIEARVGFYIHDFLNTSTPSYSGSWGKDILYSLENKPGKKANTSVCGVPR